MIYMNAWEIAVYIDEKLKSKQYNSVLEKMTD